MASSHNLFHQDYSLSFVSDSSIHSNSSHEDLYFSEPLCYSHFGEFSKVETFHFDGFNSLSFLFSRMKRTINSYFQPNHAFCELYLESQLRCICFFQGCSNLPELAACNREVSRNLIFQGVD